jgi:ankyrin repeat protein
MNSSVYEWLGSHRRARRPKWSHSSLLGAIVASACSRNPAPPSPPSTEPSTTPRAAESEPTRALASGQTGKPSDDIAASEALWEAAKTGDMATVTRLVQRPDVNLEFSKVVEFEAGWQQSRFTALAYAVYRGDEAMMKLLMEHGAKLDGIVVVAAVQAGDVALVETLVSLGASPQAVSDGFGSACYEQDLASIRKLLDLGADVNTIGYWGEVGHTCLGYAAIEFNEDMIDLLLKAGADLEALDQTESTAFVAAVMEGSIEGAAYLLRKGARSDARDANGSTALHFAAMNTDLDMIEWLLAHGADPNARDNSGDTPLVHVRDDEDEAPACVKALVEAGADVNARNR